MKVLLGKREMKFYRHPVRGYASGGGDIDKIVPVVPFRMEKSEIKDDRAEIQMYTGCPTPPPLVSCYRRVTIITSAAKMFPQLADASFVTCKEITNKATNADNHSQNHLQTYCTIKTI